MDLVRQKLHETGKKKKELYFHLLRACPVNF